MINDFPPYDQYEQTLSLYSDLHKDVYGFRPRDWIRIRELTPDELDAEFGSLVRELARQEAVQLAAKERAYDEWSKRLRRTATQFDVTFETALRWDFESEGVDLREAEQYCFNLGLSYDVADEIDLILGNKG